MKSIVFNGCSLADFRCLADERSSMVHPEIDMQKVEVPGRNGNLYLSNHRYKNLTITYSCMIDKTFYENYAPMMSFLLQDGEYHRLEGNAEKDFFRMARFTKSSNPVVSDYFQRGTFNLTFECKPQKWKKGGERPIDFTRGGVLYNEFLYPAAPILRIYGWGTVRINDYELLLNEDTADPYVDIDCDLRDAFHEKENRNSFLEVKSWPVLDPGENKVLLGEHITKMEITPRWWTI